LIEAGNSRIRGPERDPSSARQDARVSSKSVSVSSVTDQAFSEAFSFHAALMSQFRKLSHTPRQTSLALRASFVRARPAAWPLSSSSVFSQERSLSRQSPKGRRRTSSLMTSAALVSPWDNCADPSIAMSAMLPLDQRDAAIIANHPLAVPANRLTEGQYSSRNRQAQ